MCPRTYHTIRALYDVRAFTEHIELWDFLIKERNAYPILVYEFLSSFELNSANHTITFWLGGQKYDYTSSEVNALFRLPDKGLMEHNALDIRFWRQVIGGRKMTKNRITRTTQLSHPALRYIQRAWRCPCSVVTS
jgi:ATHILA ORF-1 family